jgi:hypothetical protein
MDIAGLAEVILGVRAERRGLEEIATPLSAEYAAAPPRGRPLAASRWPPAGRNTAELFGALLASRNRPCCDVD